MVEVAFGYRPDSAYGRDVIEGFNFAPAIGGSPFQLEHRLENRRGGRPGHRVRAPDFAALALRRLGLRPRLIAPSWWRLSRLLPRPRLVTEA